MIKRDDLMELTLDAQVIADLATRAADGRLKPQQASYKDAGHFIILTDKDGAERVEWLKQRVDDPARKTGSVVLYDAKSFVDYFNLHGDKNNAATSIYAQMSPVQFLAVLNDHTKDKAGWRDHRASYVAKHAPEWTTWSHHNGSKAAFNSTEAFALFIEENTPDIVKPDAATMLAIALNFRVTQNVTFNQAQRLEDGYVQLEYANIVQAGAVNPASNNKKLRIPEQFEIMVPVWEGPDAKKYKVEARFRYRLVNGGVIIWYDLVRPAKVVEQAFKDLVADIAKGTGAKVLFGNPGEK